MRGDFPRNLETVRGLRTSTLNKRTRSCISPSCYSLIAVGHRDRLTDKGEEAIKIFEVGVKPLQTIIVEQLKKLILCYTVSHHYCWGGACTDRRRRKELSSFAGMFC